MSLTARIAPFISAVMIFIMTSSELTRYAGFDWAYTINLEHDTEETSDSESKVESSDSTDEVILNGYSSADYTISSQRSFTLCCPPQQPSFGVCKIHLEPPDNGSNI